MSASNHAEFYSFPRLQSRRRSELAPEQEDEQCWLQSRRRSELTPEQEGAPCWLQSRKENIGGSRGVVIAESWLLSRSEIRTDFRAGGSSVLAPTQEGEQRWLKRRRDSGELAPEQE